MTPDGASAPPPRQSVGGGYGRAIRWLTSLIGIDAFVFVAAWGPGLFGDIGSESREGTSLGVGVISGLAGIVLTLALVAVVAKHLGAKRDA